MAFIPGVAWAILRLVPVAADILDDGIFAQVRQIEPRSRREIQGLAPVVDAVAHCNCYRVTPRACPTSAPMHDRPGDRRRSAWGVVPVGIARQIGREGNLLWRDRVHCRQYGCRRTGSIFFSLHWLIAACRDAHCQKSEDRQPSDLYKVHCFVPLAVSVLARRRGRAVRRCHRLGLRREQRIWTGVRPDHGAATQIAFKSRRLQAAFQASGMRPNTLSGGRLSMVKYLKICNKIDSRSGVRIAVQVTENTKREKRQRIRSRYNVVSVN